MGSNGASGGGGNTGREKGAAKNRSQTTTSSKSKSTNTNTGNNREDARSRSQVNTGMSRSSATVAPSPIDNSGKGGGEGAGAENVLKGNLVPGGVGIVAKSGESLRAVTPIISEAANEDTIETRKKKAKATGRSITILNRAKGISSDEGLTLGKRSLLGS